MIIYEDEIPMESLRAGCVIFSRFPNYLLFKTLQKKASPYLFSRERLLAVENINLYIDGNWVEDWVADQYDSDELEDSLDSIDNGYARRFSL